MSARMTSNELPQVVAEVIAEMRDLASCDLIESGIVTEWADRLSTITAQGGDAVECKRCDGEGRRWNNAAREVTECGACNPLRKAARYLKEKIEYAEIVDAKYVDGVPVDHLREVYSALTTPPAPSSSAVEGLVRMADILAGSREQCDEDGTMIAVSRQALEETLTLIYALASTAASGGEKS